MAFQLSPGVVVIEKDYTSIIPAVSSTTCASAGAFSWGPVLDPVNIYSEDNLVSRFGKPNDLNAQIWFTVANFLSYASSIYVTRADTTNQLNAVDIKTGAISGITSTAGTGYAPNTTAVVNISAPQMIGGVQATATATIDGSGSVSSVVVTNGGSGYTSATATVGGTGSGAVATVSVSVGGVKIINNDAYLATFQDGQGVNGLFAAKYPGALGNAIKVSMADDVSFAAWPYKNNFNSAPSVGELHIIVLDGTGEWTGSVDGVLEKYSYLSKASNVLNSDGSQNYYKHVLNSTSKFIWWLDHPTGSNWGSVSGTTFTVLSSHYTTQLSGGSDDFAITDGQKMAAYSIYANAEKYDLTLLAAGPASSTVANYIISNIAEVRKDCIAFVSPQSVTDGSIIGSLTSNQVDKILAYRNLLPSTSYGFMDTGYKYQYDRYNDRYRYVPLNGDIAGLCARTAYTDDAWFSPAGLNRGQIKNVVKLAFSPNQTERDTLYKAGVNSVVSFPGQGTVLYGDKTLLSKPSAFDRIGVRMLFIVLEKAIAISAKYQLFEFNSSFTRAQFRNIITPFLRDVQGRSGITDFRVKCDETNNTGEVIDRNEFVASVFIKPARSINYITLNFVAVRTDVSFDEIGG